MSPFKNQSVFEKAAYLHQNDGLATSGGIIRWIRSAKIPFEVERLSSLKEEEPSNNIFWYQNFHHHCCSGVTQPPQYKGIGRVTNQCEVIIWTVYYSMCIIKMQRWQKCLYIPWEILSSQEFCSGRTSLWLWQVGFMWEGKTSWQLSSRYSEGLGWI